MITDLDKQYLNRFKSLHVLTCTKCRGDGRPCSCQDLFELEVKKVMARIPPKYRLYTLDDIKAPDALKAKEKIQNYINTLDEKRFEGLGMYIWSNATGSGKTTMGCAVLMEALKKGYTGYFTNLNKIMDLVIGGWTDPSKKEELDRMSKSEFLLIDDVGGMEIKTQNNKNVLEPTITSFFKERCDNLQPTLMTSNLPPAQIHDGFGMRIYSAMKEHLLEIECGKLDFRQHVIAPHNKENNA